MGCHPRMSVSRGEGVRFRKANGDHLVATMFAVHLEDEFDLAGMQCRGVELRPRHIHDGSGTWAAAEPAPKFLTEMGSERRE